MKAKQQTIQQLERSLRKVIAKYPADADPVMTDIHLLVSPVTGEMRAYDDDDRELDRCVVEEWIESPAEDFYERVAPVIRRCIHALRTEIASTSILQPFSFVLTDDEHETLQDLELIDTEETVVFDHHLLEGLEEDLNDFLAHLLSED